MSKADPANRAAALEARVPRASAARLSLYLRYLEGSLRDGILTVSSGVLAENLGVTDAQVRKDLGYLGSLGQPGIGYATHQLSAAIRQTLGIDRIWSVALVGVGNLARALLRYRGFQQQGFRIVALFDAALDKIGQEVEGLEVLAPERMPEIIPTRGVELGLLTVPSEAAQVVAEDLVRAGIRGVLNFSPVLLRLPAAIKVVSVDLSVQLEQLAFLVQLR